MATGTDGDTYPLAATEKKMLCMSRRMQSEIPMQSLMTVGCMLAADITCRESDLRSWRQRNSVGHASPPSPSFLVHCTCVPAHRFFPCRRLLCSHEWSCEWVRSLEPGSSMSTSLCCTQHPGSTKGWCASMPHSPMPTRESVPSPSNHRPPRILGVFVHARLTQLYASAEVCLCMRGWASRAHLLKCHIAASRVVEAFIFFVYTHVLFDVSGKVRALT